MPGKTFQLIYITVCGIKHRPKQFNFTLNFLENAQMSLKLQIIDEIAQ